MRTLAEPVKSELFKDAGTLAILSLATLKWGTQVKRYHSHGSGEDVTVSGNANGDLNGDYESRPHMLQMPHDRSTAGLDMTMVLADADGDLDEWLQARRGRGAVTHYFAFSNAPSTEILGPFVYEVEEAHIVDSSGMVSLKLIFDLLLEEPFPPERYTPSGFPGLF